MELQKNSDLKRRLEAQLLETVAFTRASVMDMVQLELSETPGWGLFRARLLKIFGNQGAELKIRTILDSEIRD